MTLEISDVVIGSLLLLMGIGVLGFSIGNYGVKNSAFGKGPTVMWGVLGFVLIVVGGFTVVGLIN